MRGLIILGIALRGVINFMNIESSTGQRLQIRLVKLLDVFLVTTAFGLCWGLYYAGALANPFYHLGDYFIVALAFFLFYFISRLYNGYRIHLSQISDIIYSQVLAVFITDVMLYVIMLLVNRRLMHAFPLIICFAVQLVIICTWAVLAHKWYFAKHPPLNTVIVDDEHHVNVENLMKAYGMDIHFRVMDVLEAGTCFASGDFLLPEGTQVVFICGLHSHERNIIVKYCMAHNIPSYVIPRIGDVIMGGAEKIHLFHLPMLMVHRYDPTPEYLFLKRLMDIILSLIAVVIFSPFMIVTAIAIKATDGGSIFYRQRRLTKDGKEFDVLKFRSMRMDAEKDGVARLSTGENDPRITKVGRIIRAIRFDELPQLLNILQGDMTIVGPRPERPEISAQYEKDIPEWPLRLQCKCGLTGYAQVYGQYNTTPYDKLLMDLMYIARPSLVEDIKIIFATVKILFMKESTAGVAEGQTTAMGKK